MAKLAIKKASTDVTVHLFIQDSSKTTGEGLAGLAYNTGSLVGYYVRPKGSATAITLATQTVTGSHSDGGFVEIDATNMPGVYRLDLPDAVCATGVPSVVVMLKGAANMSPVVLEIQLTDFDLNTALTSGGIADAVLDEATGDHTTAGSLSKTIADILVDTGTTLDGKIDTIDTNVDSILVDTGTDGVKIADTQGAITWGQQKIIADADGEGALDIVNTGDGGGGVGIHTEGQYAGQFNEATGESSSGVHNIGINSGLKNDGYVGQDNQGYHAGLVNRGTTQNVEGFDPAIATASNLQTVDDNVDSILADTGTDGVVLTAAAVDAVLDEVVVGTYTMRQILTILASAMAGKVTGGGTSTITFRGINDASDVIVATVDASGNRSALTITV